MPTLTSWHFYIIDFNDYFAGTSVAGFVSVGVAGADAALHQENKQRTSPGTQTILGNTKLKLRTTFSSSFFYGIK